LSQELELIFKYDGDKELKEVLAELIISILNDGEV
jgi:hypothetical protein